MRLRASVQTDELIHSVKKLDNEIPRITHLQTATIKSTRTKDCPPSCLLRVTFARNAEGGREGDEVPPILLKFLNARRDRLFSLVGWGVGWGGWGVRWVQWGGRRCKGKILHDRTRRKQKAMASRKVLKNTYGKTKKCRKLTGEEKNCCVEIILPPPLPAPPPPPSRPNELSRTCEESPSDLTTCASFDV